MFTFIQLGWVYLAGKKNLLERTVAFKMDDLTSSGYLTQNCKFLLKDKMQII